MASRAGIGGGGSVGSGVPYGARVDGVRADRIGEGPRLAGAEA